MTTVKTAFGGGVPLVKIDKGTSIPGRFVLQLPDELTPTYVRDGFSQAVVLDQILDLQTLDTDRLVFTNQVCRELVLIITPSVTDTSMQTSDLEPGFVSVLGTFFLLGELTLSTCQFLFVDLPELGIAKGVPRARDHHRLQTQVKSYLFGDNVQELDVFFDQDGDEAATSGIFGDRHGCGLASLGQGARPVNVKRGVHLGQGQGLPIPLEGGTDVGSGLLVDFLFESRILGTAFKEIAKGTVKMSEGLLERNGGHVIEPRMVILLFEEREAGRGGIVAQALLVLVVGIGTQAQRPVVDVTSTPKRLSKNLDLLRCRIKSILVCSLLFHILQYIMYRVESQPFAPFICRLEAGSPLALFYRFSIEVASICLLEQVPSDLREEGSQ